ncbi:Cytoplasmic dynein 1 light intermediate chain 2 [Eumeta japonica]|uniref:Cytoplasmic dynein 1 light intermediate chain 2 n=1 Tax=Eumeta variegata TaxID=151549 RepID=A0A4C1V069_EUMVA|nr:Cytoplasmic dynein 1 light intermediate chain 2 [Eumeta japonica]
MQYNIPIQSLKSGPSREPEIQAEDEQAFLQRQLAALQAGTPAPRAESPYRPTARPPNAPRHLQLKNNDIATRSNGFRRCESSVQFCFHPIEGAKIGLGPSTPGNEGVLANFFNSLLYKKTGAGPGAGRGAGGDASPAAAAARSDAAAELDRLTRAKSRTPLDLNSSEC